MAKSTEDVPGLPGKIFHSFCHTKNKDRRCNRSKGKEAAELKRSYFGPEGELAKMRDKLITPIQDDIYEAVKAISQQHGYDLVIDRASATGIIFANPRIDISDEILRKLGYSN
ncbi:OmpH family outer membrane protein [Bacteroides sp. CR5/BHMF/2]|nr:OmpH family outer membrane protein [Bacteroides sp. CR5/BHMF/2]